MICLVCKQSNSVIFIHPAYFDVSFFLHFERSLEEIHRILFRIENIW